MDVRYFEWGTEARQNCHDAVAEDLLARFRNLRILVAKFRGEPEIKLSGSVRLAAESFYRRVEIVSR
jgi:hypothetical protein